MNFSDYVRPLTNQLEKMPSWKTFVFALAVTQRAQPNWQLFNELIFKKNPPLQTLLDPLWQHPLAPVSKKALERYREKITDLTPDPLEYDYYGAYPAMDAALSTQLAVQTALAAPEYEEIEEIIILNLNTIGKFIRYTQTEKLRGTELFQYITEHALFLSHLDFMDEVIGILQPAEKASLQFIGEIRTLAVNNEVSLIGVNTNDSDNT